jgi:hypothetical protein
VSVRIPSDTTTGVHRLVARGLGAGGGTREVGVPITVAGTLATTGSDVARLTLLGVATVALGHAVSGIRRMLGNDAHNG